MRLQTIHFPCLTAVHLLTYSLTGPLWTISYLSSTCSARRAERYKRQSIWRAQKPNQEGRTQLELCLCVKLLFSSSCHRGSPTSKPREESVRRHMWETPGQLNCSGDTQLLPIVSVCWTATSIPTGLGSLGFCWCWAGKALQKQGSLSHLGGWVGFLQGGENRIVLGEATQCTGMKVGTCHTRDFPCVFWLSQVSHSSHGLARVHLFSVSQFKVIVLVCPPCLQRNVFLFSLDFACVKRKQSQRCQESQSTGISLQSMEDAPTSPLSIPSSSRTHVFPWSHPGSLGRHKTLSLVLMMLAWKLAHTWSKDTFCLLLPSAGARIQLFLRTRHRAVIHSIFVILQLFYQRWIAKYCNL